MRECLMLAMPWGFLGVYMQCLDPNFSAGPVCHLTYSIISGRAIAQPVSRRLPTAAARVQTRVWSRGIS
jgi:hypothetical protein